MWDFSVQTGYVAEAWRPYLVVVDKKRTCKIIDFAVPGNKRIEEKEKEKLEKKKSRSKKGRFGMWE